MKKIKICFFINGFVNGGVESVIYNYIKYINKSQFEIQIISYDIIKDEKAYQKFLEENIKIHMVSFWKRDFIKCWKEVNRILENEQYDIMHAHMNDINWIPILQAYIKRVPIRITHSHMAYNKSELSVFRKVLFYVEKQIGKVFSNAQFACSMDALREVSDIKDDENYHTYIMKNAIETHDFLFSQNKREKVRSGVGLSDEVLIGHIGRFEKQKNHKFIIDVFLNFHNKYENSKLLLVGMGNLETEIKRMVQEKGIEKEVIFYGTTNKVCDLYNAIDIFVFPSLWEGLGIVCIEAQVNNLPVIVSSNIPIEVKISSNLRFLELKEDKWVDELLKTANEKKDRNDFEREQIENSGYDIQYEVKKLESKYIDLVMQMR